MNTCHIRQSGSTFITTLESISSYGTIEAMAEARVDTYHPQPSWRMEKKFSSMSKASSQPAKSDFTVSLWVAASHLTWPGSVRLTFCLQIGPSPLLSMLLNGASVDASYHFSSATWPFGVRNVTKTSLGSTLVPIGCSAVMRMITSSRIWPHWKQEWHGRSYLTDYQS